MRTQVETVQTIMSFDYKTVKHKVAWKGKENRKHTSTFVHGGLERVRYPNSALSVSNIDYKYESPGLVM